MCVFVSCMCVCVHAGAGFHSQQPPTVGDISDDTFSKFGPSINTFLQVKFKHTSRQDILDQPVFSVSFMCANNQTKLME